MATLAAPAPATFWQRVRTILNQWFPNVQTLPWYGNRRVPGSLPVTPYSALSYSAVFACVRVIAETLAMLPWEVFESRANGTTVLRDDNPVSYLLGKRPNPDVPAMTFREQIIISMLLWGAGFAEIEWGNNGTPRALWQVPAQRVVVERDALTGQVLYRISGDAWNAARTVAAEDMLHWRNIGVDGFNGLSTIQLAQNSISFGQEMELFGSVAFRHAPFLAGWIEYPGKLPDEERSGRIKQSFRDKYMGWTKAGETPILESGMIYHPLELPLKDAQFLESRQFQALDITRWFRVPPHKIGILEEASYANIEALEIDFYNETLLPMTVRLQQEIDFKLFEGFTRTSKFFSKHSLAPILKGSQATRYTAYSTGLRYGFLSINEVRQMEDLDPIPNGEMRSVQLNTVPLDGYQERADAALAQALADVDYREAQVEQLESGNAAADAADATDGSAGNGQPGQNPFEPTQAENPPEDDQRAAAALRKVRMNQLMAHSGVQPTMRRAISKPPISKANQNGVYNSKPN